MKTEPHQSASHGHLVNVGGHEDLAHEEGILRRFVELAGGARARLVDITAAKENADDKWELYDKAFGELGVARHRVTSRAPC